MSSCSLFMDMDFYKRLCSYEEHFQPSTYKNADQKQVNVITSVIGEGNTEVQKAI